MSEDNTTVEPTKVSLSYEVKIGLPNYSNVVARAFVERRVVEGTTEEGELSVAFSLAAAAVDEALHDFGGIAAIVPQVRAERTSRGKTTEIPVEDALLAAFPGAEVEDEAPAPKPSGRNLRVVGKQHGDLPDWIYEAAAAQGVTKIFDNRDGLKENARRPWFKDADGGREGAAFWPPKS